MSGRRRPHGILGLGRGGWIGLFLIGFLLTCATAASAFWTIPVELGATHHARAEADTLSAPASPTAKARGSSAIDVGWSLPGSQVPGAGYRVTRTSPGLATVVCTVVSTATTCRDNGLTAGTTYAYSIVAVIGSGWQSPAVSASATTLGVATTSLMSGSVGATYSTSLAAVGGKAPYTWALTAGALPGWATLNPTTGAITGTPSAVGTTSGLVFTVTDADNYTAASAPLSLAIVQGATRTTVVPSLTSVTYGAESQVQFAVTVRTDNNAAVASGSVTVSVGPASCTVTLPAPGCTIGNTALDAGGPYPVSATFAGGTNLAGSTGNASSGLTVTRDSSTFRAFGVSGTPAFYGDETSLVFTATVAAGIGSIPNGRTVDVTAGSTPLCTMTLMSGIGSCSPAFGTVLPVGSYTVTAAFNASGADPNFLPASATTGIGVSPDTATVAFTVSGNPAVYGAETGLLFAASVTAGHGTIPDGTTVTVTQGATTLCTMTLASQAGSCRPTSDTVLPVGSYTVTATFNAGGANPNFVTTSANPLSITITPSALAGIEWASVSTTGTFACTYGTPNAVTCTATGVGNRGTFQAGVQLVDANRNVITNATGTGISVTQTTTGGGGTTTSSGSLTIAPSASTTPGFFTLTMNPGQPAATTIMARIIVNGVPYTVTCIVSR